MASTKKPKAGGKAGSVGKRVPEGGRIGEAGASVKKVPVKVSVVKVSAKKGAKKASKKQEELRAEEGVELEPRRNPGKHRKIRVPEPSERSETETMIASEMDPFEIAKQTMKGSVPAIVEAMVEAAKQGSYTHAKTLLEMTGAKRMFDSEAEQQDGGEPWAKLVLARLDEAESSAAGQGAAEEGLAEVGQVKVQVST